MSNWKEKIDEFSEKKVEDVIREFLLFLKSKYEGFLNGDISDEEISNMTIYWLSTKERFSDSLIQKDRRIKELRAGMDITHPDFSKDRKNKIIKELINRINELIN
jgi:hypothetical protein